MTETDKNQAKERVGQSDKIVQMFFYPQENPLVAISALPVIQQTASDFFAPSSKNYKNIIVIETPSMAGINIPHFREWYQKTGRYLEGYMQHTRTGFLRNRPMSQKQLKEIRSTLEKIFSRPEADIAYSDQEELSQLSFFAGLIMLDRLAQEREFTLEIEPPSSVNSRIEEYKQGRRLLRKLDTDEINPDRYDNPQELLEVLRRVDTSRLKQTAELVRQRVNDFHQYLGNIITRENVPSKILVLREISFYGIDELKFQNGYVKDICYDFSPSIAITGSDGLLEMKRIELFSRFLQDPTTEVTKEQEIEQDVLIGINNAFQEMNLGAEFQENLPHFLGNVTAEELENLFISFRSTQNGIDKLLDFFGEKTNGVKYSFQYQIAINSKEYFSRMFSKNKG